MKKLPMMIAATLLACLAAGPIASAGHADSVRTKLSVKYKAADPADPYATSRFNGKVGPRKCAKNRKVSVSRYGKTKTASSGRFSLTIPSPAEGGRYKIKVAEKQSHGVLCKKAKAVVKIK